MEDAAVVRMLNAAGQAFDKSGGLAHRRQAGAQLAREVAAGDILEREKRPALVLADLVDLHDVRVLEASDGFGLAAKARKRGGIQSLVGVNHLERDDALEICLPRLVDDPHAAAAEHLE